MARETGQFILTTCARHSNCTMRLYFAQRDGSFDEAVDAKPCSARLQERAERDFGDVFCVGVDHLKGSLHITRSDVD